VISTTTKALALVTAAALAAGCATQSTNTGGNPGDTARKGESKAGESVVGRYDVPRHPLMITRSAAPRTSLAVAAENGVDVPLEINREASVTYKRHDDSGVSTQETMKLADALDIGDKKVTQVAQLKDGATLHRIDVPVTVKDALTVQSLMGFLKRLERHSFLTASTVQFSTTKKWWGVCKSKTKVTVSAWFARGTPSLPETQVHLPKVSATRVLYSMINGMRSGELHKVKVGNLKFTAKGTAKDDQALQDYVSALEDAHRCIKSVSVDQNAPATSGGGVAFTLTGRLKCRTR